ncbi:hypothetical protein [Streptomyces sp. NPDC048295]|uniref:hypothetical protein n=1 Tax=Streptomyces sp. NPDC048295 TaxID=3154617 RepID=UPI003445DBB2
MASALPNRPAGRVGVLVAARPIAHHTLHFTPIGSSWITQVERWFGFLADQKVRGGPRRSMRSLEAVIHE